MLLYWPYALFLPSCSAWLGNKILYWVNIKDESLAEAGRQALPKFKDRLLWNLSTQWLGHNPDGPDFMFRVLTPSVVGICNWMLFLVSAAAASGIEHWKDLFLQSPVQLFEEVALGNWTKKKFIWFSQGQTQSNVERSVIRFPHGIFF